MGCVIFSVALKIEMKEIIRNKYLKNELVKKPAPKAINSGVAIQCTKQMDELKTPIISALFNLIVLIIFELLKFVIIFE